jgi:hypothetical protein
MNWKSTLTIIFGLFHLVILALPLAVQAETVRLIDSRS